VFKPTLKQNDNKLTVCDTKLRYFHPVTNDNLVLIQDGIFSERLWNTNI